MGGLFTTFIKTPIYNGLVALVSIAPGADVGLAIIVLTVIVKLILLPLSLSAIRSQVALREIDPELKRLRSEYKDNQEELGRRTMALFKEKKVNPLASFVVLLLQLPIIFGLYKVFLFEGQHGTFDQAALYSFVHAPEATSFMFLGVISLTTHSIALALIVAVSQFLYARALPAPAAPTTPSERSFQTDLAQSMHIQMRYVFPVLMGAIAYAVPAAIALYFVVSNVFALGQELAVRHFRVRETTATARA